MPTWGQILKEIQATKPPDFDAVRRKYLSLLAAHLDTDVISYSTAWTQPGSGGPITAINAEDVQAFMEVVHGLRSSRLTLILHSPGGSPESTEAIVQYLRQKFEHITVIVPQAAMSAATMLACACDRIYLGKHSSLGPIDPQMVVQCDGQMITAPAAAIEEQFRRAQRECKEDPAKLTSWIPILRQYGPALLAQCRFAEELSRSLVQEWLAKHMFSGEEDAEDRAKKVATALAKHDDFKTHGRFICRERAKELGLKVSDLEDDQILQDLALSVFHSATITFSSTPTVKIVENHLGKAFVKSERNFVVRPPIIPMPEGNSQEGSRTASARQKPRSKKKAKRKSPQSRRRQS